MILVDNNLLSFEEAMILQVVMITDPALAMHILYSPHFDKFRFNYSFLEQVIPSVPHSN